jgi:uncharacterized protein YjbI with pentapeptide repeats
MLQMDTKMIGNKIAEARKKINLSQAQLAQHLFISAQAVGKWERGESLPDLITLNRLAEILGVDLNYFSENFPSASTAMAPNESADKQTAEIPAGNQKLPSGKIGKKLNWDMSRGNWVDADFSGLKNLHDKFSSSNMLRCKFIGSDLSGLYLKNNNVNSCDFSNSDFSKSLIQHSNLSGNILKECLLNETEFTGSFITDCDFTKTNFTGTVFKGGGLEKGTLTDAVWKHTSFKEMYLANLELNGIIDDCYFENCAFKRVIFRNATLLNNFFKNKNLKGISFVNCQADRMTYEFLKNGKADLTGLTMKSA